MPLYGDGRSGIFSATVTQYGGYQTEASVVAPSAVAPSRLAGQPGKPPLATLTDDFTTADTTKWTYGAAATATGGQLVLTPNPSYTGFIQSNAAYDLTGSELVVEMPQATNVGNGGVETYLSVFVDNVNTNSALFDVSGGNLIFWRRVGGVTTEVATRIAYSATAHRWLRLRESAGSILWDTSPDRTTWTNQATWAPTWSVTVLFVALGNGYGGTEPSPGTTILDNVNVAPATGTPATAAGSIVLGATTTAQGAGSAAGSVALAGTGTPAAAATAPGSITLGGTGTPQGVAGAAGAVTLAATGTGSAAPAAAGSVTLSGTGATSARSVAPGTVTLAGTGAATVGATGTGALALSGTGGAGASTTGSGAITLTGTGAARAASAAAGTVTLAATGTVAALTAATGTVTLGGSGTGAQSGTQTAAGSVTLGGTATARATSATAGTLALSGTGTASATPSGTGAITLGGTAAAGARATAAGTVVLGGAATVTVPATAHGLLTLSGLANGAAAGALRNITVSYGPPRTRGLAATVTASRLATAATSRTVTSGSGSGAVSATARTRSIHAELV